METERLYIREIQPEDEKGLFELDSDPDVHRYLGAKPISTMEEARAMIANIRQQYQDNGIGRWAVIEKSSGDFMGWTGFKRITIEINKHIDYYDLGYRFIRKYWGRGYATESALASLMYGFETMQLKEVYGMVDVQNHASKNILEKVGLHCIDTFDYEGKKHFWMKLTKDEWLKQINLDKIKK